MQDKSPDTPKPSPEAPKRVIRETTEQWDDLPPGAKVVGKRRPGKADLLKARPFFEFAARIRRPKHFVPRGVYRFKTFEEADAWHLKMITRR